jgi:hypothetical protein
MTQVRKDRERENDPHFAKASEKARDTSERKSPEKARRTSTAQGGPNTLHANTGAARARDKGEAIKAEPANPTQAKNNRATGSAKDHSKRDQS